MNRCLDLEWLMKVENRQSSLFRQLGDSPVVIELSLFFYPLGGAEGSTLYTSDIKFLASQNDKTPQNIENLFRCCASFPC